MNREQATELINGLFDGWYPTLLRYAFRLSGNVEMAEDLVQETFFCLYRELARGKDVDYPKAWCLCVLRRQFMHHRQSYARKPTLQMPDNLDSFEAGRVEPEYAHFLFQDIRRFFGRLSEREEQVLLLRMDSMKYGEIAGHLGIATNSVSTLLARALRKLRIAVGSTDNLEQTWVTTEEIDLANALR